MSARVRAKDRRWMVSIKRKDRSIGHSVEDHEKSTVLKGGCLNPAGRQRSVECHARVGHRGVELVRDATVVPQNLALLGADQLQECVDRGEPGNAARIALAANERR